MKVFLLVFLLISSCLFNYAFVHALDSNHINQELLPVVLGGVKQWIYVRTENVDNPIILYLHGGPGTASLPLLEHYNSDLEKHFIVVNWDQRGAGKSYDIKLTKSDIKIEYFLSDLEELVAFLLLKYNKKKIFLIGHSWGTYLGVKSILKKPDNYYAYISVGQVVNGTKNEQLSYDFTLNAAKAAGNNFDIWQLEKIGYPYNGYGKNEMWDLIKQRFILYRYGGGLYNEESYFQLDKVTLSSRVYTLSEKMSLIWGSLFVFDAMWEEFIEKINLDNESYSFEIPVFFFIGAHDYTTPFELAIDYFNKIDAPLKEITMFENSAHCAIFEEPEKFNRLVIEIKKRLEEKEIR